MRDRQRRVHHVGTQQNEKDHRRGCGGAEQGFANFFHPHIARQHRQDATGSGADRRGFCRIGPAAIDADDDDDEHQQYRQHFDQATQALRPWHARTGGPGFRIERDHDLHHQHVAEHGDDARQHSGHEQFADRFLRQDGVDHQRHRRWNHDAQCAAGRQCAGGQGAGITVAAKFRQGNLTHGGRRCER